MSKVVGFCRQDNGGMWRHMKNMEATVPEFDKCIAVGKEALGPHDHMQEIDEGGMIIYVGPWSRYQRQIEDIREVRPDICRAPAYIMRT